MAFSTTSGGTPDGLVRSVRFTVNPDLDTGWVIGIQDAQWNSTSDPYWSVPSSTSEGYMDFDMRPFIEYFDNPELNMELSLLDCTAVNISIEGGTVTEGTVNEVLKDGDGRLTDTLNISLNKSFDGIRLSFTNSDGINRVYPRWECYDLSTNPNDLNL